MKKIKSFGEISVKLGLFKHFFFGSEMSFLSWNYGGNDWQFCVCLSESLSNINKKLATLCCSPKFVPKCYGFMKSWSLEMTILVHCGGLARTSLEQSQKDSKFHSCAGWVWEPLSFDEIAAVLPRLLVDGASTAGCGHLLTETLAIFCYQISTVLNWGDTASLDQPGANMAPHHSLGVLQPEIRKELANRIWLKSCNLLKGDECKDNTRLDSGVYKLRSSQSPLHPSCLCPSTWRWQWQPAGEHQGARAEPRTCSPPHSDSVSHFSPLRIRLGLIKGDINLLIWML